MTICPFATWRPISANTGRPMQEIRGFSAHSQVGYGDLFNTFNNPARKASTHFQIMQNGDLTQFVDTDTQAWAHGPGNPYFWSSEFEGMSYNDGDQEMDGDPFTSAQIDKAGQLIAWLHGIAEFPVVINTEGLAGYGLTPHRLLMQTACPGMLRLGQYHELVLSTLRHLDQNPTPGDDDVNIDDQHTQDVIAGIVKTQVLDIMRKEVIPAIVGGVAATGSGQVDAKTIADAVAKAIAAKLDH